MHAGTARTVAAAWVQRHASAATWFRGAYFAGSATALPDDADLAPTSDLDVFIVTAEAEPPMKLGKFLHDGVRIEVSYVTSEKLAAAEQVLAHYHLAEAFRRDSIIADPTGHLRRLVAEVAGRFAQEAWVRRRCAHARQGAEQYVAAIDPGAPWRDQVTSWLFGAGVTTHVLLVAALRNPTVRLRYLRAREVLQAYSHQDFYPELLGLLGCLQLSPARVSHHVNALARTFDTAAAALKTPYRFASDISPAGRPLAIDGSLELIRSGCHREAIFWIVATFARCHTILAADAPAVGRALEPDFSAVLADLGIASTEDLVAGGEAVRRLLPRVLETAESILAVHPDILRDAP